MGRWISYGYVIFLIGVLAMMQPDVVSDCDCEGCTIELESLLDDDGLIDISTIYDTNGDFKND